MTTKLESALELAGKGFTVFPLVPNKKTPIIKQWQLKATTEPEQIRKWWAKTPKANIGIACRDQFVVIDIDIDKGKPGAKSLGILISEGLPKTLTHRTASGGLHLIYQHPGDGHVKSIANWRPGVDIRGDGGFIVGPGSEVARDGRMCGYTTFDARAAIQLNKKLSELLPRKGDPSPSAEPGLFGNTNSLICDSVSPYSELPERVILGGRDDFVFKTACSWRERGYTISHARILMGELHTRCEQRVADEFTLDDALAKLDQAWKTYSPSKPDHWTQVVTPDGPVAAPSDQVASIKEALSRFVLTIKNNYVIDLNRQPQYAVIKLDEFKNAFKNVYISDKPLPTVWLGNKNRQTVLDLTYYPSAERIIELDNERFYNTYTPANLRLPDTVDMEQLKPFIDHVEFLMGSRDATKLFLKWCAITIQKPHIRIPWAPLIITTTQQVGKGLIYQILQKILGPHNTAMIGPRDISDKGSQFNEFLSGTLLVCLDEMKTAHKWDSMETLKPLMTEKTLMINHKHGHKGQENIFANFICFSNHLDAAALEQNDGRFWVIVNREKRKDAKYYIRLGDWLEGDGPAHLKLWLQQMNCKGFDFRFPPPMTEAKKAMIEGSRSPIEVLLCDAIEDRDGPFKADIVDIKLVERYIMQTADKPRLSTQEQYQIRQLYIERTEALAQERYRVQLGDSNKGGERYRCRSVRKFVDWFNATPEDIAFEYKKAWCYAQGREAPVNIKKVVDNKK